MIRSHKSACSDFITSFATFRMKSLVTGGAGFLGSHVVDHLITIGHDVVVLDDFSGGRADNVHPKAIFVNGSITDYPILKKLFSEHKFDYVYHLAAYAAENMSHFVRRHNYENNVLGSINLINESVKHNIKCFVFTSSIAVYGKNSLPYREEEIPQPIDPYGIAKYAVELDLLAAHQMFDLDYIIFRPHNIYGERQNIQDPYRNVIGIFMNQVLNSKPLTIFGDGHQTRAFTYVKDIAPYIATSVEIDKARNQTFNIGADHTYTVKEIAEKVLEEMNSELPIEYLEARHEIQHAHSDHHKFRTIFHLDETETSLSDGLEAMARWAKEQGIQSSQRMESLEINKNLPGNWKS